MSDLHTTLNLKEIIKATLFVAGEGVEISAFASKLDLSEKEIEKAITELGNELNSTKGIQLIRYRNKIQLASNPNYANEISGILNPIRERALTRTTLETLSIIAYRQPITRLEIEEVRGVSSDYAIQVLLDHNLIEVIGRKDVVGKPLLFGTTDEFLKRFGLVNMDELPDQETILDRIRLISEPLVTSESLFNEYQLPPEEEIPDFLLDESDITIVNVE